MLLINKYRRIHIELLCDGVVVPLPSVEGIAVLNIGRFVIISSVFMSHLHCCVIVINIVCLTFVLTAYLDVV